MVQLHHIVPVAYQYSGVQVQMCIRDRSMSDQQVLEYVKTGMQQGKDQRQIATELARRGVTQEQAKRCLLYTSFYIPVLQQPMHLYIKLYFQLIFAMFLYWIKSGHINDHNFCQIRTCLQAFLIFFQIM